MKKIVFIIMLAFFATGIYAQGKLDDPSRQGPFQHEKLEELRQLKLMEELDLDEETSVRFFKRQSNYRKNVQEIRERWKGYLDELTKSLSGEEMKDQYYSNMVNKIIEVDGELFKVKNEFFKSCADILTPKQIAKVIAFDFMFFRELRGLMMDRGRRGRKQGKNLN